MADRPDPLPYAERVPNNTPYRVVQWTTGNVGKSSVAAIAANPTLELVGCYAWSKDKVGRRLAAEPAPGEQLGEHPDDARETRIGRAVHSARQTVVGVEKSRLRHRANDAVKLGGACAETKSL